MPRKYHRKSKPAPADHPRFFEGVEESDLPPGWELLLGPKEQEAAHYTAERVVKDRKRYDSVVQALGMNMSADDISKLLHVHHRVVAAIVEREKVTIDELKSKTGELMLKSSALSVRAYITALVNGEVDPKTMAIASGIHAQNGMLLTGQPTAILETRDRPGLSVEAVNGFWERIKAIKGAVGEGEREPSAALAGPVVGAGEPGTTVDVASTVEGEKTP